MPAPARAPHWPTRKTRACAALPHPPAPRSARRLCPASPAPQRPPALQQHCPGGVAPAGARRRWRRRQGLQQEACMSPTRDLPSPAGPSRHLLNPARALSCGPGARHQARPTLPWQAASSAPLCFPLAPSISPPRILFTTPHPIHPRRQKSARRLVSTLAPYLSRFPALPVHPAAWQTAPHRPAPLSPAGAAAAARRPERTCMHANAPGADAPPNPLPPCL